MTGGAKRIRPAAWISAVVMLLAMMGCRGDKAPGTGPASTPATTQVQSGFLTGTAMLADASEGQHAGILIYLAGTGFSAHSDEKGAYRIDGITRGSYSVMAEKQGYTPLLVGKAEVNPDEHTSDKPLIMQTAVLERPSTSTVAAPTHRALGTIIGTARLRDQGPTDDIRIRIDDTPIVTITDTRGAYTFMNVEAGRHVLRITREGYDPRTVTVVVPEGGEVIADEAVLVSSSSALSTPVPGVPSAMSALVARESGGNRTINGLVEISDAEGGRSYEFSSVLVALDNTELVTAPDEQGRFKFVNLAPAVYTVLGTLEGLPPVSVPVDLSNTVSAQVTLKLGGRTTETTGTGTVIGRVILPDDNDAPMEDASGVSIGIGGTQFTAISARDGRFKIEGIPAGVRSLVATKEDYQTVRLDEVEIAGGQTVDVGELVLEAKRDYPRVISTEPTDGTRDVIVDRELIVSVKFSKPMNEKSVVNALQVEPRSNVQAFMGRGGHPKANDSNLVLVFSNMDENSPIKFNTNYRITIGNSAADQDGLRMRQPYSFAFHTGAPGVVGTYPVNGARGEIVDNDFRPLTIQFNTKLRGDTIRAEAFRVRPSPRSQVMVLSRDDPRTGWTTVNLRTMWAEDTNYTVTVERGVRAFNGQTLSNTPYTFKFRTGRLEPISEGPPKIVR